PLLRQHPVALLLRLLGPAQGGEVPQDLCGAPETKLTHGSARLAGSMQRRSPSRPASRSPWHRWLAGLAVLALVGSQWLGLAHSVLHAPHAGASWTTQSAAADGAFGHDKGSPLCPLLAAVAPAAG